MLIEHLSLMPLLVKYSFHGVASTSLPPSLTILKLSAAKVKISSTDHIGLLAHDVFNVSIPKHHIPSSEFVFQHGPAENDPTFGSAAAAWGAAPSPNALGGAASGLGSGAWGVEGEDAAVGIWVGADGGQVLGGESGIVEFTVVGSVTLLPDLHCVTLTLSLLLNSLTFLSPTPPIQTKHSK